MKTFIFALQYFSSDWHDWHEQGSYLTYDGSDNIPEEKIAEVILQDFTANHASVPGLAEEELRDFGSDDFYETESYEGCTVSVKRLLSDQEDAFVFDVDCFGIGDNVCYEICRIADDDVVYLPVRQYVCAPKITALAERCFTPFFRTLAEAEAAEAILPEPGIKPFYETHTYILRTTEKELENKEWYRRCLLAVEKDPEFKHWSPLLTLHLKQIDANIA